MVSPCIHYIIAGLNSTVDQLRTGRMINLRGCLRMSVIFHYSMTPVHGPELADNVCHRQSDKHTPRLPTADL